MTDRPIDYVISDRQVPPADKGYLYSPDGKVDTVDKVKIEPDSPSHRIIFWSENHPGNLVSVCSTEKLLAWIPAIDEILASPLDSMSIKSDHLGVVCQLGLEYLLDIRHAISEYCNQNGLNQSK